MDSSIYVLDLQTGDIIDSMQKAPSLIIGNCNISFNGKRISAILGNGSAVIWDDSTKHIIKTFQFDTILNITDINGIALSPDGRYCVGGASSTFSYFDNPNTENICL